MNHAGHGWAGGLPLLGLALALGYECLAVRASRWSPWRTASFMAGCALLMLGLVPTAGFAGHMLAHLLVGMFAPLGLVLGAPMTLVLRVLRPRRLVRLLHARPLRLIAHPVTALALSTGTLAMLYLTPLYGRLAGHPLLHVHFLLAGCLFVWAVAGPDPAPRRPPVPVRLVVLGVAIAAHTVLSQLLYAGAVVDLPVAAADRQAGATLMYYGGDIAELLLAFALVATWRPRRTPVAVYPNTPRVPVANGRQP